MSKQHNLALKYLTKAGLELETPYNKAKGASIAKMSYMAYCKDYITYLAYCTGNQSLPYSVEASLVSMQAVLGLSPGWVKDFYVGLCITLLKMF